MPNLSAYLLRAFGIGVYMFFFDTGQHNRPHVHVRVGGEEAVLGIPDGDLITGTASNKALRKARAWIELNEETLMQRWHDAAQGIPIEPID